MLLNLRITQRLGLLLLVALAAMMTASVPGIVDRVDDARAAQAAQRSAERVHTVAVAVAELQRERILSLAYVLSDRASRTALVSQVHAADEAAAAAPEGRASVAALSEVRQAVLRRDAEPSQVARVYHDTVVTLLNQLRLTDQPDADVVGQRQLSSLDTLMRLGEEASVGVAALLVAVGDKTVAGLLARDSATLVQSYWERFQRQATPSHVTILAATQTGPSALRSGTAIAALTYNETPGRSGPPAGVEQALSIAQGDAVVRYSAQMAVVSDIGRLAAARARTATGTAVGVAVGVIALLATVAWLSSMISRSVNRPLRRVTLAATAVADLATRELRRVNDTDVADADEGPPRLAAVTLRSADEIGELASAFNRVQATAALLMQQQVTTRRNVAVMYSHIANRTRSLVERQLASIDKLERDEFDEQRLAHLYRLDHLTTRLRRSAESLLVIAGQRDAGSLGMPTPLHEIVRSAVAQIEQYRQVDLGTIDNVVLQAGVVVDLTLMLAELLENATVFSPPDVPVEFSARLDGDCHLRIVDHGVGMSAERLEEENRRLVSRERLDVTPTKVLGLFVVGRLARRHGMTVRLLPSVPVGVTVEIVVPATLLLRAGVPEPLAAVGAVQYRQRAADVVVPVAVPLEPSTDFRWFDPVGGSTAGPVPGATGAEPEGSGPAEPDRNSRPNHASGPDRPTQAGYPEPAPETSGEQRGGLRRRIPGQHLAESVRGTPEGAEAWRAGLRTASTPAPTLRLRDPEAERAELEAFQQGLARAAGTDPNRRSS
ncbi:sensor histidine kinase [Acrocarpospora catenulata]|uniref:sensor histidine kinase n=1 Tax=Acrocarpospora catenulata TaxID=2836182 RepID=UPI001BDAF7C0|nr:sensor histidine kinase [Acrocarpospora catenulata]